MILRVFRAVIRENRIDDFKRLVQEQSIPWLVASDGMLGYFAGEPFGENEREFTMVTLWRDLNSIKAFCGDDWNNPIVTEDEEPLVEAMYAEHYQQFDR
jgi:hypothetical protein